MADKQPVTDGGRTIVMGLLFLTMLMEAVYTGSLNTVRLAVISARIWHGVSGSNYDDGSHCPRLPGDDKQRGPRAECV